MTNWRNKANKYRENFDILSYQQHSEIYKDVLNEYPIQNSSNISGFNELLKLINIKDKYIFELGGWMGDLADVILKENEDIIYWHNYDIVTELVLHQIPKDNRYKLKILDDFVWNKNDEIVDFYNIFVSTHTIEHFSINFLNKLVDFINNRKFKYLILEAPLPKQYKPDWNNHDTLHVLSLSWYQIFLIFNQYKAIQLKELYRQGRPPSYTYLMERIE